MRCLLIVLLAIFIFCCLCPLLLLGGLYFWFNEPVQEHQTAEVSIGPGAPGNHSPATNLFSTSGSIIFL